MVEIFDDRVEITNPGGLLFEKEKFGHTSVARNPVLLDTFFRFSLAEKIGSGVNRIRELVEARGLGVEFDVDRYFRIVFRRPTVGGDEHKKFMAVPYEALKLELTGNEIKILTFCSKEPLSSKDIAQHLGHVNVSGSDRKSLSKLISMKYLEYTKPGQSNVTGQKYKTNEAVRYTLDKAGVLS